MKKKNDDLSLENLTMFDFSPDKIKASIAETEAEKQVYKDKYGDNWREKWHDHILGRDLGYDQSMKFTNSAIYSGGRIFVSGDPRSRKIAYDEFDKRLHEVYGDKYDELKRDRIYKDPRVADLLIDDAIRAGKWKELPDELQGAYHRRVEGIEDYFDSPERRCMEVVETYSSRYNALSLLYGAYDSVFDHLHDLQEKSLPVHIGNASKIDARVITSALDLQYRVDPLGFACIAGIVKNMPGLVNSYVLGRSAIENNIPFLNDDTHVPDGCYFETLRFVEREMCFNRDLLRKYTSFNMAYYSFYGACYYLSFLQGAGSESIQKRTLELNPVHLSAAVVRNKPLLRRGYGVSAKTASKILSGPCKCEICGHHDYGDRDSFGFSFKRWYLGAYPAIYSDMEQGYLDFDHESKLPVHVLCTKCNHILRMEYSHPMPDWVEDIKRRALDAAVRDDVDFETACSDYDAYFGYMRMVVLRHYNLGRDFDSLYPYCDFDSKSKFKSVARLLRWSLSKKRDYKRGYGRDCL